jgi:superfamily II DNA or RNA helicase
MEFVGYLYCVGSDYTDSHNMKKLGFTIYPEHRMRVYNTGDAPGIGLEKRYNGIWQLTAKNKTEGFRMEKVLHDYFLSARIKRKNGNYSEWFSVTYDAIKTFLGSQSFVMRELSIDEIDVIHKKSQTSAITTDEHEQWVDEANVMKEQSDVEQSTSSQILKEEFFATFLEAGCVPRRIQLELWDLFEDICRMNEKYKGIVQWATGTGKTLAILMLFLLSADKCMKEGRIFRGILIAPTNDIFDTIIHHIQKLSRWGILVCEGHNGNFSSLEIPRDKHILVTATHASLTKPEAWAKLPPMVITHYDEVHRITGDEFYTMLNSKLREWDTQYITGTSATPKTCSASQHKKITDLFGTPLNLLHKCDVDEAIAEGWIAQPRFCAHVIPHTIEEAVIHHGVTTTVSKPIDRNVIITKFIDIINTSMQSKRNKCLWKGGKCIAYLPSREDVCEAVKIAKELLHGACIYTAVDTADASNDKSFVADKPDGTSRILFACERYREGSDIKGLEMTAVLMGNTIGANIILQIVGRALRKDYAGKEGWCVIARPSEEGTTEEDVMNSIILRIMEFAGKESSSMLTASRIRQFVTKFFGDVSISGRDYGVEETILRIQALYVREEFEGSSTTPKEKYDMIRNLNKEMGLTSKLEYEARKTEHLKYIDNPKLYFSASWISWYHYLGIDTSAFPPTKAEWVSACKAKGLTTWEGYKTKRTADLPSNPGEMYPDYMNWDMELGIVTVEHVW